MRALVSPLLLALTLHVSLARAALTIPSDGSDGDLIVTSSTNINLGNAVTAAWDTRSPDPGKGVYDPEKWAVVFKYSSVSIAAGATVTFANHPSRAPVVWLVSGDVTIAGKVDLSGKDAPPPPALAEPGPGGFRGGSGYVAETFGAGTGFGIGGGDGGPTADKGFGGSYGSTGLDDRKRPNPAPLYGNPSNIPLLGGSGGGSSQWRGDSGGGGGGGAILVACSGVIDLAGSIVANGGNQREFGGSGSGGAIRLVAKTVSGAGLGSAVGGGIGGGNRGFGGPGGLGRIRVEGVSVSPTVGTVPEASVVSLSDGAAPAIWPDETGPSVRIVSIGGRAVPSDPRASFGAFGADVALPRTNATQVVVETRGVEPEAKVMIRRTPRANARFVETVVTEKTIDPGNPSIVLWKATIPLTDGGSGIQVHVIRPSN